MQKGRYRGRRDKPPPDKAPNSTYRCHFGLAQNFSYSSRTGRYSAASSKLGKNHRNQPIAMTWKANPPQCFRLGRPTVHIFYNDTACSNSKTFKKWFNAVFLPPICSCTSEKVALLVDNASSHSNLYDIREQVVVIPLPPNVTFVHKPMDRRQAYRRFLVQELVRYIESHAERRAFYQGRTYGMNGMAQGYDPHMLDAANLAAKDVSQKYKLTEEEITSRVYIVR